jgi:two-component system OmpR family sensor kinase
MMRSLRGRLFVGLAVFILATGSVAGAVTFRWAYAEALEAQDAVLLQVGALVAVNRVQIIEPVPHGVDAENRVVVEELTSPHGGTAAGSGPLPCHLMLGTGCRRLAKAANGASLFDRAPTEAASPLASCQRIATRSRAAVRSALYCRSLS